MSSGRALSRRRFLAGAGGVALAGAAAGCGAAVTRRTVKTTATVVPVADLGGQPAGLPARQHAWEAVLERDQYGNAVAPRFDRLLMFDVVGEPDGAYRRLLEAQLRGLERSYPWNHDGLLFLAGWGSAYFTHVLGAGSPVPKAKAMSNFELPTIDEYDLCLHLASDHEQRLSEVSADLIRELSPILSHRQTRTGFVGAGLPYARQDVSGIPASRPVPRDSPLYMGFKSALKKNQASEDAVTIPAGRFAQGTTMQVSYMRLRLDSWYQDLSEADRVALMYSPQTSVAQAKRFANDAESNPGELKQAINRYAMIGHAQSSATARRDGKPIILRRDFDTTDGGLAGLHFVCLQRSIEDFVKTRQAMNQPGAQLQNPAITNTQNNGINAFMFVLNRENFIVPSRADRSFPLLEE